jgi:hypothetical protein
VLVVVEPYASVQPDAVVVEVLAAAIASVAVLGKGNHVPFTLVTVELVLVRVERQTILTG